jgi:hypothetical protein
LKGNPEDISFLRRCINTFSWIAKHGLINFKHQRRNRWLFDTPLTGEFPVSNTSVTDSEVFASYSSLCGLAARNMEIFNVFRRSRIMVDALDHVSIQQGKAYIVEILNSNSWSNDFTKVLMHVDSVGEPRKFRFRPYGTFSPTLLRYLKVYIDLKNFFGPLKNLKIAEIGIGFGGQATLINLLDNPLQYTCFDLPPVLDLAKKFMNQLAVPDRYSFIDGRNPMHSNSDLVISNYAFSEMNRNIQDQYLKNVILPSPRGYITWNNLAEKGFGGYTLAELVRIIPSSQIYPERPTTSEGNVIVIWGI